MTTIERHYQIVSRYLLSLRFLNIRLNHKPNIYKTAKFLEDYKS